MKWERTDLVVGSVVVAAAGILAGTLLWLLPSLGQRTFAVYTEFDNVDGIGANAPVQLHGYRVGRVGAIEPRMTEGGTLVFRVRMEIDRQLESGDVFQLPQGTQALLTPPPLPIGLGWVVLSLPSGGGAPLEPGSTIPGRRALVAMDQIQTLTSSLDRQLVETTATARALMDTLTVTAATVNRSIATTHAAIPGLVQSLQLQLATSEALTADLRGHLNTLTPAAVAGIDSATVLLADSRRMVQQLNGMLATSEQDITGILENMDATSRSVESLVRQFSARPLKFIFSGARLEEPAPRQPTP